jgi:hypothetical protein
MALPTSELTPENWILMTIDRQVGLMSFLTSIDAKNVEAVKQMLKFTGNPPIG